jgi:hypothetical protein
MKKWFWFLAVAGCGGVEANKDAATDGAGDAPIDLGIPDDAGFTKCSTPDGYRVCGPLTDCPVGDSKCSLCQTQMTGLTYGDVGLCQETEVAIGARPCSEHCDDGRICIDMGGLWTCAPQSLGYLIAKYAAGTSKPDRVRYSDMGMWTGSLLPLPQKCMDDPGFRVCGGNCGGCSASEICTGRSPLHPFGFCIPDGLETCSKDSQQWCKAGTDGCFLFSVEMAAQTLADNYGMCLPIAECTALAARLPGGGTCIPK